MGITVLNREKKQLQGLAGIMNITNIFFGLYEKFSNSFRICYALKCII